MLTGLLVLILLLQGGFSDAVWALGGIAASLFLLFYAKKRPPAFALILMLALVTVYAVSAAFHGLPFEALAGVSRVTVALLLLLVFYNINADISETVFITGFIVAAIGFLALGEILPWSGAVLAGRLQSVFQYANAAGFFIGISAFLTRLNKKCSAYTPFLEAALILTQSVGALVVYTVGWVLYLWKNKNFRFQLLICGFAVSAFLAGSVFALVSFTPIPQLGILPPILLLVFRNKLQQLIDTTAQRKGIIWLGGGVFLLGVAGLFLTRGLLPFATYLERLIHIGDGLRVVVSYPLGIGPGAWQHELFAHQSALYSAAKIHSEPIAAGVDAGFLAVVILCLLVIYWFRKKQWDEKSVCAVMLLLAASMDIPFSFLSITMVALWLAAITLPEAQAMPKHRFTRTLFVLPLTLCCVVFFHAAMKNHAAWVAQTDPPAAAAILERLPIRDTDADLRRMSIYLQMERHDLLDALFAQLSRRTTVLYGQRARSLMQRGLFEEAAEAAIASMRTGPHRMTGHWLMEEILPHLDETLRSEYLIKIESLIPEPHPLIRFIDPISPR